MVSGPESRFEAMVSFCNWRFSQDYPVIVRRSAALGDVIAATIVADRLDEMGYNVVFQSYPFYHAALRYHPRIIEYQDIIQNCHVNLDNAYEQHPRKHVLCFHEIFIQTANQQLESHGIQIPMNLKPPRLYVLPQYRREAEAICNGLPRPWVMINPRSINWTHRTVQPHVWEQAARMMDGTKFWIGLDPCPSGIVDLQVRHVDRLVHFISCADLVVTVDSGPAHIAAALQVPLVVMNQSINPELTVGKHVNLTCVTASGVTCTNCQHIRCPINGDYPPCQAINPDYLAYVVNNKLKGNL